VFSIKQQPFTASTFFVIFFRIILFSILRLLDVVPFLVFYRRTRNLALASTPLFYFYHKNLSCRRPTYEPTHHDTLPCLYLATLHSNQYFTQSPSPRLTRSTNSSHHITSHHITSPYSFTSLPPIMPSIRSLLTGLCLTSSVLLSTASAAALPPRPRPRPGPGQGPAPAPAPACEREDPTLPLTGGKSCFFC